MSRDLFSYSAFGLSIGSELPLPELRSGSGKPDVLIRRGTVPFVSREASRYEQLISGTRSGTFRIREGREVVVEPLDGADIAIVGAVLLGRVMPCLLWQRGWLPLHASGVAIDGAAALFVGPSGSGKSTMAAAMHVLGHAVFTDDVGPVKVEGNVCEVLPSMSRLRLLPDTLTTMEGADAPQVFSNKTFQVDKYSIALAQQQFLKPLRLKRIYFLDFGPVFRSEPVSTLAAIASLSAHSFIRRHRFDRETIELQLNVCASLGRLVPVRHLSRPKGFDTLADVARSVEEDMTSD